MGFFFWVIAARYYGTVDVGLATATISAVNLLASLSHLGFGTGIIRFLPDEKDRHTMINTCFTIVGLLAFAMAGIFVFGIELWSPALSFLRQDVMMLIVFIITTFCMANFTLQNFVFIAYRSAGYSLILSLITALRLPIMVLLINFSVAGIVSSYGIGFLMAFLVGIIFLCRIDPEYRPIPSFRKRVVENIITLSFGNYVANNLASLPRMILPIILVNIMTPEMSAYFFISWMIANLLFSVSYYTGESLLAEISHSPHELRHQLIKAAKLIFAILIPANLVLFFFGNQILSFFGVQYAEEGLHLLWMLAVSSIPLAVNEIFITICLLDKRIRPMIIMRIIIAAVTIGGGYFLIDLFGLNAFGLTWLSINITVMLFILPRILKRIDFKY
jgi:O-antigen/teichoic acid export membrane protein